MPQPMLMYPEDHPDLQVTLFADVASLLTFYQYWYISKNVPWIRCITAFLQAHSKGKSWTCIPFLFIVICDVSVFCKIKELTKTMYRTTSCSYNGYLFDLTVDKIFLGPSIVLILLPNFMYLLGVYMVLDPSTKFTSIVKLYKKILEDIYNTWCAKTNGGSVRWRVVTLLSILGENNTLLAT